jgi:hypothetical protein
MDSPERRNASLRNAKHEKFALELQKARFWRKRMKTLGIRAREGKFQAVNY